MTSSIQSIGLAPVGSGISLVAESTASSINPILCVKSLIAGPGIKIIANDSFVDVTISATGLPGLTSLITGHVHWVIGGVAPSGLPIFTAAFPLIVTAIVGRVETISSTTATLTLVKVLNGIAIASGVALSSSAFNAAGTVFTNQNLPLVSDITVLSLAVGDSIGVQTTGTWTGASGGITIHMAPAV